MLQIVKDTDRTSKDLCLKFATRQPNAVRLMDDKKTIYLVPRGKKFYKET